MTGAAPGASFGVPSDSMPMTSYLTLTLKGPEKAKARLFTKEGVSARAACHVGALLLVSLALELLDLVHTAIAATMMSKARV